MNKIKPAKVFIVDDHPVVREGMVRLINQKGKGELKVCGEADNAGDALEAITKLKPDVVVTDISIKGPNGFELIKMIRAQYPKLPVLVLSMHDEFLYAERAFEAGANGYIMKQEASEKIITAIKIVLRGGIYSNDGFMRIVHRIAKRKTASTALPEKVLSGRELEVFWSLGCGRTKRQIAEKLHLSMKTIGAHCEHIREKLGLKTSNRLIQRALQWVNNQPYE